MSKTDPPTQPRLQVTTIMVHHKHGTDVFLGGTPEEAYKKLHTYVLDWWADRFENLDEVPEIPKDRTKAIEMFFDNVKYDGNEWYDEGHDWINLP